ncbi:biliverdin-producing heme oxygenase [Tsuneonella amylolytica]|uniref:biliverdin-producing heme oxygenase n=1 Tax=Tsuneonella amylolytica TaxID=2338327 RepID=UPI0013C4F15E|nr:biliverdin-producing heme oxygenase [Tsuneonella amylolytica]
MAVLDLAQPRYYARFLQVQYAARLPIEAWVGTAVSAALRPPVQTPLIAADLAAIGHSPPRSAPAFSAPAAGAIGVAWALAGSSLGNGAMLADLRKRDASVPVAFLSDDAMPAFFARLRPRLQDPFADTDTRDAAIAAARAVFSTFAAVLANTPMKRAA